MRKIGYLLLLFLLIQACQSNVVYNKYRSFPNDNWKQEDVLTFEIPMQDSISKYNLFINIRNTKEYSYSNLFLITQMTFPDKTAVIDTLEYEMTDSNGNFLGSGFSDIKENKLFYKEKVQFKKPGTYLFHIKQAMRKRNEINGIDPLKGISDVGISIEKIK
jgi:gliding motility-associated lipoprotein GldH